MAQDGRNDFVAEKDENDDLSDHLYRPDPSGSGTDAGRILAAVVGSDPLISSKHCFKAS